MCFGISGFDSYGLLVTCGGAIQITQFFQRIAKVVMRLGIIGIYFQCLEKTVGGVLWMTQIHKRCSEGVMSLDKVGIDGQSLGNEINSNVVVSALMGNHTKKMQGDRLIGIRL